MTGNALLVEKQDKVVIITLNRPEVMNAINLNKIEKKMIYLTNAGRWRI